MKKLNIERVNGSEMIALQAIDKIPMIKGARYRIIEQDGENAIGATDVMVTRQADTLHLRCADCTEVSLEGYGAEVGQAKMLLPVQGGGEPVRFILSLCEVSGQPPVTPTGLTVSARGGTVMMNSLTYNVYNSNVGLVQSLVSQQVTEVL